LFERYAN
jgi:hypothetical protein